MKRFHAIAALAAGLLCAGPATAQHCTNIHALGTARTITVDPALGRVGTMQYRDTLPLAPKEVVLTFDDGPMPPMTNRVLEVLRAECVRATFFLIGRNARARPDLVRAMARDGHTIANHTENHPLRTMGEAYGVREFESGFRTIAAALEAEGKPAPFIRFPGLLNSYGVEAYAKRNSLLVMSADLLADDWTRISPQQMLARGIARLEAKGSGIMLLHDVQPGLALILPKLLEELKTRGYRIVHVVPARSVEFALPPAPVVAKANAPARTPAAARAPTPKRQVEVAAAEPVNPFFGRWRKYWKDHRSAAVEPREP